MKLYYDHPAENWHESLPLGNGRIGAMVYGGTKKEILALNEDTLWSGYPEKTQKKLPEGYLEKARELAALVLHFQNVLIAGRTRRHRGLLLCNVRI